MFSGMKPIYNKGRILYLKILNSQFSTLNFFRTFVPQIKDLIYETNTVYFGGRHG